MQNRKTKIQDRVIDIGYNEDGNADDEQEGRKEIKKSNPRKCKRIHKSKMKKGREEATKGDEEKNMNCDSWKGE